MGQKGQLGIKNYEWKSSRSGVPCP